MANITETGWRLSERHWRDRYEQLAEQVRVAAPGARPVLISTTVDVDDIYVMTPARLRSLRGRGLSQGGVAAELALGVGRLLSEGRDGELFWDWPEGWRWLAEALGPSNRAQVGGTGPQAAWLLSANQGLGVGPRLRAFADLLGRRHYLQPHCAPQRSQLSQHHPIPEGCPGNLGCDRSRLQLHDCQTPLEIRVPFANRRGWQ